MSRATRKMVNLSIEETSGVDHPAHLHEGWLVMKAADPTSVDDVINDSMSPEEDSLMKTAEEQLVEAQEALAKAEARIEELEVAKSADPEEIVEVEETTEAILKEAPEALRKAFESMEKAAEEAVAKAAAVEAVLVKERGERADADAIVKAREAFANLGIDAEHVGPALRRLADTDADLAKSVEDILTAANAKVESADIFSEIGKSARPSGGAYEQAEALAKAAVAEGRSATIEQALTDVFVSNGDLYKSYVAEQGK